MGIMKRIELINCDGRDSESDMMLPGAACVDLATTR